MTQFDILDYLQRKLPGGKLNNGLWYNTHCLNPHHADSSPSFGIHLENGHGYCFSCQFTAPWTTIVALIEGVSEVEATVTAGMIRLMPQSPLLKARRSVQKRRADYHPWFQSRGIKMSTVIKYELGYDKEKDEVYGPAHYPDGTLAGYVRRSAQGKQYINDPGMEKSEILLGYHLLRYPLPRVYCAEGWTDYLLCNQEGLPSVGRLGWVLGRTQIKLLRSTGSNPTIIIDNDHLGQEQADRWTKQGFDIAFAERPHKDPGKMMEEVGYVRLVVFPASVWIMKRMQDGIARTF